MTIKEFSTTLLSLMDDLCGTLHDVPQLKAAASMVRPFLSSGVLAGVVLETFWSVAKVHAEAIREHDADALLEVLGSLLPGRSDMARQLWHRLDESNRNVVMQYIETLYGQAKEIHGEEKEQDQPVQDDPSSTNRHLPSAVCGLYNRIFLEFLRVLGSPMEASVAKMEMVLAHQGADTELVFAVMRPLVDQLIPPTLQEHELLAMVVPPGDALGAVAKDCERVGESRFPLGNMTMAQMLDCLTQDEESASRLFSYWHYIKLLTHAIAHCPEPILKTMAQMVSGFLPQSWAPIDAS